MKLLQKSRVVVVAGLVLLDGGVSGCSPASSRAASEDTSEDTSESGGATQTAPAGQQNTGGVTGFDPTVGEPSGSGDASAACVATQSAEAALEPVTLAVAFDVSGSMGKLDFPYHDPTLKWAPVVAATKAFFIDPASAGISASLVFFPIDTEDGRCSAESYDTPDVPITPLPSDAFGDAIDEITPASTDDWRGGTPTLAVIEGTIDFILPLSESDPHSRFAMVLVSDGYPQGCDDDSIDSVAAAVEAVSGNILTYVIGVANPPGGPDTVTNLNRIAVAGGTERAFIIETGDPQRTKDEFEATVRGIRSASVSCEFEIPPPPAGQTFDPARANVTYTSGSNVTELGYDAACGSDAAWRYDDPALPTRMVLCDATCARVQADPTAVLRVEFGCSRRDVIQ